MALQIARTYKQFSALHYLWTWGSLTSLWAYAPQGCLGSSSGCCWRMQRAIGLRSLRASPPWWLKWAVRSHQTFLPATKKTRDMDKVKTLYYLYRCCLDLFCSVVNQEESIDSSVAVRLYISMLKSSWRRHEHASDWQVCLPCSPPQC